MRIKIARDGTEGGKPVLRITLSKGDDFTECKWVYLKVEGETVKISDLTIMGQLLDDSLFQGSSAELLDRKLAEAKARAEGSQQ